MAPPKLKIIVVGAGLGGLGAAIALLLAGHDVLVLEAAKELGEVGAGIQVLPNSSRVLRSWGLGAALAPVATSPDCSHMIGWRGDTIATWDYHAATATYASPFWDFHRADLHRALVARTVELGGEVRCDCTVADVVCDAAAQTATVVLVDGRRYTADLVVGADGINSKLRGVLTGRHEPPTPTGDLAYRILLRAETVRQDPELAAALLKKELHIWLGPDAHVVSYTLRGGEFLNMVLCMPDDIPDGERVVRGNIEELKAFYKDWDPRILRTIALTPSADKWKLCIRSPLPTWVHPTSLFLLLGDAVHATLPYLASGAGITFEDGAVLGACLSPARLATAPLRTALAVYESCRKARTERVVARGSRQGYLAHLPDGEEQQERDRVMREEPGKEGEAYVWRDRELGPWLLGYDHVKDVDAHWRAVTEAESGQVSGRL